MIRRRLEACPNARAIWSPDHARAVLMGMVPPRYPSWEWGFVAGTANPPPADFGTSGVHGIARAPLTLPVRWVDTDTPPGQTLMLARWDAPGVADDWAADPPIFGGGGFTEEALQVEMVAWSDGWRIALAFDPLERIAHVSRGYPHRPLHIHASMSPERDRPATIMAAVGYLEATK